MWQGSSGAIYLIVKDGYSVNIVQHSSSPTRVSYKTALENNSVRGPLELARWES